MKKQTMELSPRMKELLSIRKRSKGAARGRADAKFVQQPVKNDTQGFFNKRGEFSEFAGEDF